MPIATVASVKEFGLNGYTTTGIDTTGANLLVWTVADNGGTAPTLTDSYSNTWTLQQRYIPIAVAIAIYYCESPTVGTGHTFTCTKTAGANSGQVRAYSGAKSSGTVDQSNANLAFGASTLQPGSVTPTEDGELVVTAMNFDTAASVPTIDSSFVNVLGDVGSGGAYIGSCSADLIQTTAGATNPTWTYPGTQNLYAIVATFRSSGVVGAVPFVRPQLSVYRM